MPIVYIVNRQGHDYSDARRFGQLVFLSEGSINKYSVTKMYRIFAERLKGSTSEDYILISGLTVMACIACACFGHLHKRLNVLLFKDSKYVERRIVLDSLLDYSKEAQSKQVEQLMKGAEKDDHPT